MKLFSTDRRLLLNVLFALALGIVFGNFLGNKIIREDTVGVIAIGFSDEIYLIQTGIYYDEMSANIAKNEMQKYDIDSVVVQEHNLFYLYHGVASDPKEFDEMVSLFQANQIDYFIKSKHLYKMLENLDTDSPEYEFSYESINYYLYLVRNQSVKLDAGYVDLVNPGNLELFNNINTLNNNVQADISSEYKLYIYQNLAKLLM